MNTSMNIQRIGVDRLKPAKYNPRKDLKPGDPAYLKRDVVRLMTLDHRFLKICGA